MPAPSIHIIRPTGINNRLGSKDGAWIGAGAFLIRRSLAPYASRLTPLSFDHLVSPRQHVGRNRHADLLRRFQVDHQLELDGLLHREITRLGSFQDLVLMSAGRFKRMSVALYSRSLVCLLGGQGAKKKDG